MDRHLSGSSMPVVDVVFKSFVYQGPVVWSNIPNYIKEVGNYLKVRVITENKCLSKRFKLLLLNAYMVKFKKKIFLL